MLIPTQLLTVRLTDNASHCPVGFVDSFNGIGNLRQGEWQEQRGLVIGYKGLLLLNSVKGSRFPNQAVEMRNAISEFVNTEDGSVIWQEQYVTRTEYC